MSLDPAYPVMFRERADVSSLKVVECESDLVLYLEEFADIVDEFEAWDRDGHRLRLRWMADMLGAERRVVWQAASDPDPSGLNHALSEFARARGDTDGPGPYESPSEYVNRISSASARGVAR